MGLDSYVYADDKAIKYSEGIIELSDERRGIGLGVYMSLPSS